MKTPDEIAANIVNGLSFSSNRMVNGRLVGEQHFAFEAIKNAILDERRAEFTQEQIERAADSLRCHEMSGRLLNSWEQIAPAQRRKWIAKAKLVLEAAS